MKLTLQQLASLNAQYGKLKKDKKIISIDDVRKGIELILDGIESLEELIEKQVEVLNEFNESCEEGKCKIGKKDASELYEFYDELEDKVLSGNLYKALRMISK